MTVDRGYRPISDYAVIGDMHSAALIAADGSIDWACLPYFDSPALFLRLLDRHKGGYCSVDVNGLTGTSRRYRPRTNILETTFTSSSGAFVLSDFMRVRRNGNGQEQSGQIVRLARCTAGQVEFSFDLKPTFGFGGEQTGTHAPAPGVVAFEGKEQTVFLQAPDAAIQPDGGTKVTCRMDAGASSHLVLSLGPSNWSPAPLNPEDAAAALKETESYWTDWSSRLKYEGDYENEILRSLLVLKLLTFAPTGAIVAAPTTSLPEVIGGDCNWDYRLSWIRDSQFALTALMINSSWTSTAS